MEDPWQPAANMVIQFPSFDLLTILLYHGYVFIIWNVIDFFVNK